MLDEIKTDLPKEYQGLVGFNKLTPVMDENGIVIDYSSKPVGLDYKKSITGKKTSIPVKTVETKEFKNLGIEEIYCCSVNDAYTMNAWSEKMKIKNVKLIPDGNGHFTKQMGMLISKDHLGFGNRSWRYMAVITDGIVEKWWEEPGINNNGSDDDPYGETMPEKCLEYLSGNC